MRSTVLPLLLAALALPGASTEPVSRPTRNPFAQHMLPALQRTTLHGEVLEQLNAGAYTYLRLLGADGTPTWLVSLTSATPQRGHVRALVVGRAQRFHSRRLGRDFSPLLFAAVSSEQAPGARTLPQH